MTQHSSDISSSGGNAKEEEFLHGNTNTQISVCTHVAFPWLTRGILCFSLSTPQPQQLHGGVCFIPIRVETFASFIIV